MRRVERHGARGSGLRNASVLALAAVLALGAGAACAAQGSSAFVVTVNDKRTPENPPPPAQATGLCRTRNLPGAFGALVTVVCATGVVVEISPGDASKPWGPLHGGAYRFLPPVSSAGVMSPTMDIDTGLGTVTSWRVVRMSDRSYVEMTVRW